MAVVALLHAKTDLPTALNGLLTSKDPKRCMPGVKGQSIETQQGRKRQHSQTDFKKKTRCPCQCGY